MADIQVANTDADLSGNTVVTEENAYTITGVHTFSRSTSAPFAVNSGAAVVANLDADKLDGQEGSYYLAAANATGTLAVNRGGTGAATFTDGGVLLGSGTGAITAMAVLADGAMIVGDGTTDPVPESGATLRTSIGVGTGDSPQFTGVNVGHASDTTLTRASAGDVNIEGNAIYRAGGTDVPVADGGTGASSLTDGGVLLGSGTAAITPMAVLADGEMIVGDGSGDPVAESGATLRTSIGVGTGDSPQFTGVNVGHASDTTVTRASAGDLNIEGNIVYRAGGTDVPVADGGTGVGTLTDGGVLLGSGTSAITPMAVLADSEMIVGDGSGDPVAESGSTLRTSIGCDVATNITSGTMATARLGSGTADSSTFLRGDSSWAAAGGGKANYVAKTSDATLTTGEIGDQGFVAVTTTGGAVTITLFTASGNAGVQITIIKANAGANAVTIDGHSSETVEGVASTLLYGQSDYITIVSDGTNWRRKSEHVNIHCHVGLGSNQSIATSTWTKILFDTELVDSAGAFASNKFTAPRKGVYHAVMVIYPLASLGTGHDAYTMFYKNGSNTNVGYMHTTDPGVLTVQSVQMLQLDKDDYLEGYIYQSVGGAVDLAGHADLFYTRMQVTYIGSGE